jgi:FtsP/CotA-like multicopper oxidase with cupredoxin domain
MSHASTAGCPEHELHTQVEFSSSMPHEGSPVTEFKQTPNRTFLRKFFNQRLRFPDGFETEIWSFEDERSGRVLPAPLTRALEGELVQVKLEPSKRVHTIHHHGMEPDPRNDGVGHTSFEVTGSYTYQWRPQVGVPGDPNTGTAGSYFYHCHVNTTLHVQMGMFGPMIFDPRAGRGKAFVDDPVGYDTRAETYIAPFAIDPRWHTLDHAAGLQGEDVGLNRFQPSRFYLLGGNLNGFGPGDVKVVGDVLATAPGKTPGLVRFLNASYFPINVSFLGGLKAEVFAHDGRPLRNTAVTPSPPVSAPTDLLSFGAAERYDMRLRPPAGASVGSTFSIRVDWLDWITRRVVGTRSARVRII